MSNAVMNAAAVAAGQLEQEERELAGRENAIPVDSDEEPVGSQEMFEGK